MKWFLVFSAVLLALMACKQKVPQIQKEEIIGVWDCLAGGEAEQYEFHKTDDVYGFYIYSGRRLYSSGTWELENNLITMKFDWEDTLVFPVTMHNDSMIFGSGEMIFKRSVPYESEDANISADIEAEDTESADSPENPVEGLTSLVFSDPEPIKFSWNVSTDRDSSGAVDIEGFVIRTKVELAGDYSPLGETQGKISQHLKELGYSVDMFNASEITDGYIKDNNVVLFRLEADEENPVGEAAVAVLYGKLNKEE